MAAAMALSELEAGRLPDTAMGALDCQAVLSPSRFEKATCITKGLHATPALMRAWDRACDAGKRSGEKMFMSLASKSVSPRVKTLILYGTCRLGRHGLIPPERLGEDWDTVMFAHAVYELLSAAGPLHPLERKVLVMLAQGREEPTKPMSQDQLIVWPDD